MKCNTEGKGNQGGHKHSPLKHMLHMVLCCGLPILLVGLLPVISRLSPGAGNIVSKITPFICPIMMVAMLPMMFGGNKKSSCCENSNNNSENKEIV